MTYNAHAAKLAATQSTIALVALTALTTDPSYQRATNTDRVARIQKHFAPYKCTSLLVNKRADGTLVLLDGQCRAMALTTLGIAEWPAVIYSDLSVEDEAKTFLSFRDENGKKAKRRTISGFSRLAGASGTDSDDAPDDGEDGSDDDAEGDDTDA